MNNREPVFPEGASCPQWLPVEGKREWRRTYRPLLNNGMMTIVDRALLTVWCETWARYVEAREIIAGNATIPERGEDGVVRMVEVEGGLVITTDKGNVIQHPAVGIMNQAAKQLNGLASHFGFSPAARARIIAGKVEGDQLDAFAEYEKKEMEKMG